MKLGYKSIGFLVGMFIVSCGSTSTKKVEEKDVEKTGVKVMWYNPFKSCDKKKKKMAECEKLAQDYRPVDGWCNNLKNRK